MITLGNIKRTHLGLVADFCPFCRRFSTFKLKKHALAGLVYSTGAGRGGAVAHSITCETCKIELATDGREYAGVSSSRKGDINQLIAETNPTLVSDYSHRLEIEWRIEQGLLTKEQRMELIKEPILLLADTVEARAGTVHIDKFSGLWLVGSFCMLVALVMISEKLPKANRDDFSSFVCLFFAVAVLGNLVLIVTDVNRFVRRQALPHLVRSLTPLNPTIEELTAALGHAKSLGLKIARKIKANRLYEATNSNRAHKAPVPSQPNLN